MLLTTLSYQMLPNKNVTRPTFAFTGLHGHLVWTTRPWDRFWIDFGLILDIKSTPKPSPRGSSKVVKIISVFRCLVEPQIINFLVSMAPTWIAFGFKMAPSWAQNQSKIHSETGAPEVILDWFWTDTGWILDRFWSDVGLILGCFLKDVCSFYFRCHERDPMGSMDSCTDTHA